MDTTSGGNILQPNQTPLGQDPKFLTYLQGFLANPKNAQRLQNRRISNTSPTDGQVLAWSAANNQWQPTTPGSSLQYTINGVYTSGTETDILTPGFTPKQIYFYGILFNSTSHEIAIVVGQGGSVGATLGASTMYYYYPATANQRVNVTNQYLALVQFYTGSDIGHIAINSWSPTSVSVTAVVASGYTLTGVYIITG